MTLLAPALLTCGVLGLQDDSASGEVAQQSPVDHRREIDAHNYMATRLRLLQRGEATDHIRTELVSDIDFAGLSPDTLDLLKRLLTACTTVSTVVAKEEKELALLRAAQDQEEAAAGFQAVAGAASGNILAAAPAVLQLLGGGRRYDAQAERIRLDVAATIESEIAAIEFDLGLMRSRILAADPVIVGRAIRPSDYETFLKARELKDAERRLAQTAAVALASPSLQPAQLAVAQHYIENGDLDQCRVHADLAIETSPAILRRDVLRAHAYLLKANVAAAKGEFDDVLVFTDAGLKDDAANVWLLRVRASELMRRLDHRGVYPVMRKLALLLPSDPWVLYNLACCEAVVDADVDRALQTLENAMTAGWVDVAHARADPDLEVIRRERGEAFSKLTSLKLEPSVSWGSLFSTDRLLIRNGSCFPLTQVQLQLRVTYSDTRRGATKDLETMKEVTISALGPGEQFIVPAFPNVSRHRFKTLRVGASGPQGHFEHSWSSAQLDQAAHGEADR